MSWLLLLYYPFVIALFSCFLFHFICHEQLYAMDIWIYFSHVYEPLKIHIFGHGPQKYVIFVMNPRKYVLFPSSYISPFACCVPTMHCVCTTLFTTHCPSLQHTATGDCSFPGLLCRRRRRACYTSCARTVRGWVIFFLIDYHFLVFTHVNGHFWLFANDKKR